MLPRFARLKCKLIHLGEDSFRRGNVENTERKKQPHQQTTAAADRSTRIKRNYAKQMLYRVNCCEFFPVNWSLLLLKCRCPSYIPSRSNVSALISYTCYIVYYQNLIVQQIRRLSAFSRNTVILYASRELARYGKMDAFPIFSFWHYVWMIQRRYNEKFLKTQQWNISQAWSTDNIDNVKNRSTMHNFYNMCTLYQIWYSTKSLNLYIHISILKILKVWNIWLL